MIRNRGKRVINVLGVLFFLILVQTVPVLFVAPLDSHQMSGEVVRGHYHVMLVSSYTPVERHTYETILQAARHEYVHALVRLVNPGLSYFWDNGLAAYLAGQKPAKAEFRQIHSLTLTDRHTENGLDSGNMDGYSFSTIERGE